MPVTWIDYDPVSSHVDRIRKSISTRDRIRKLISTREYGLSRPSRPKERIRPSGPRNPDFENLVVSIEDLGPLPQAARVRGGEDLRDQELAALRFVKRSGCEASAIAAVRLSELEDAEEAADHRRAATEALPDGKDGLMGMCRQFVRQRLATEPVPAGSPPRQPRSQRFEHNERNESLNVVRCIGQDGGNGSSPPVRPRSWAAAPLCCAARTPWVGGPCDAHPSCALSPAGVSVSASPGRAPRTAWVGAFASSKASQTPPTGTRRRRLMFAS